MYIKLRPATLFLLAALFLTSACLLFETGVETEEWTWETDVPAEQTIPEEAVIPEVADGSPPACLIQLESMLAADANWDESSDAPEADQEYVLVTYQVSGDEISSPEYESDVPDEFIEYQDDSESHAYLWEFFTNVIPADQREMIGEFIIFTDGYANTIGAVAEADTPGMWTLEMDIIDSQDIPTLATTLIHEFAHMLTLNEGQLNADASFCETYWSLDGCSKSDSYINAFYDAFWTDIYDEWSSEVLISEDEVDEDAVLDFYDQYPDQFVTDYAPTGPEEDIAESWVYFVFGIKPAGNTIAEQKILFFYNYPELMELRLQITNGLCQYTQE